MNRTFPIILSATLLLASSFPVLGQGDDKVDVFMGVSKTAESRKCTKFELGKPIRSIAIPEYPSKARSMRLGGAVRIEVLVGPEGKVVKILETEGDELLMPGTTEAVLKARFSPSLCDGVAVSVKGIFTFNFVPLALTDVYIAHSKAEEFGDVGPNSPFYESILSLTENYKLAFGYADGRFHPNAPIIKGDFAHFLRLTLDLLQNRAEVSKKIPRDIDLYFPANPQRITTSKSIVDLDSRKPYANSVGFLIAKYDIALTNEKREFNGNLPLTLNEVIEYWEKIFGKDAIPVNFNIPEKGDRVLTRGEFALFLQESLYVLTYKVLP